MELLIFGIVLGFGISLPPGPVAFEVIKRGLGRGFGPAFPVGLGAALADLVYASAVYFGAIHIITDHPRVQSGIFLLGSILLVIIGVMGFFNLKRGVKHVIITEEDVTREMQKIVIIDENVVEKIFHFLKRVFLGFTMGFLNPTAVLLFITILPPIFAKILEKPHRGAEAYLFVIGFSSGVILLFALEALFASIFKNLMSDKAFRIITIVLNSLILVSAAYFLYRFIDTINLFFPN